MAVVVVGGNSRNIGKTGVVAGLIASLPDLRWTALKITQYGHGVCSANGEPCDCATADHTIAVSQERNPATGTDSSRYLAAGAASSWWVRTQQGELHQAMPRVRRIVAGAETLGQNVIVESNSVLRFLRPTLALSVLDPAVQDFKASALRYLDRVDALIMPAGAQGGWPGVSAAIMAQKRRFEFAAPEYVTADLAGWVRAQLAAAAQG